MVSPSGSSKRKSVGKVPIKEKRQKLKSNEEPPHESSDSESDIDEEEGGIRIGGVYIPPAPPAVCSSETAGPRLIITHIVNFNFKSYAGRQTLGPFHKSFTSIVGPNGSGKSNVIDSMLFVFGYRASKIRSKKISVLLHKSEHFQHIKSCTVEVHFVQIKDLDGEDFEVIPNTEIVIGRSAFHDNSSNYTINGKRAQFKEVAAVLRSHGIDLVHNRFLILQGEVEQIAMMKPKAQTEHDTGMLEYLEDIIGTTRYKKPLQKLEAKLVVLNEERQEKMNRVKLAEKDKEALKGPMEQAVVCLKKANSLADISNKLYQKRIYENEKRVTTLKEQKAEHENQISEFTTKIKTIQQEQTVKDKEVSAKYKEIECLKAKKERLTETFRQTENDATKLKEEIIQTNKKRKKAIETKTSEEQKLIELEKIPNKNKKEIEELQKLESNLQNSQVTEEAAVELVLAGIRDETQGLQDSKDVINNKLIGFNKTRDEAKAKYELAKTELDVYQNNEKKAKSKLVQLQSTLEKTSSILKEKKLILEDLETKIPTAESELSNAQKELNEVKHQEQKSLAELNKLRAQLQEKRSSLQDNRSRNRVLDFIMKKKAEGVLPGVFGRLGDLGGIDNKYNCAVSTACGPLDYIVTDTVRTAKSCVEQLKRFDVGRGNFIALDQQEGLKAQYTRSINTPENVPRLFDLIKVNDERVKPAFYFGLRDTLVANDLSQAKRCAYGSQRYRVVTLGGEIIEIAGTMSGGGREKRTGRMGRSATVITDASASSEDLSQLEDKVNQIQLATTELHRRMNQLEETVSKLNCNLKKWKMELNGARVEVKGLSQQEPALKQQVKDQESVLVAAAPDPEKMDEMTHKMNLLKNEFDKAVKESGKLEEQVDELSAKINALTGGKMKEAQSKLDKVVKQLGKVTAEITKLTVGIKTSGRNAKKTADRIENLTNEITDAEDILLNSEKVNKNLIEKGADLNTQIEAISNNLNDLEDSLRDIKSKAGSFTAEINKLKAAKLDENQKIDVINKSIQDVKAIIPVHQRKLDALKLYEIPEEEDQMTELPKYTAEELEAFDEDRLDYLESTFESLEGMESKNNLGVIKDYKEKSEFLKNRLNEFDDICQRRNEVRFGFEDVRKARLNEFMAGFAVISCKLKEMYQMITLGGDAEFDLIDSLDPFSEGVLFSVRPPKKSWKNISNLSGGEKTLSSLALVFALHYYKPSPLYVMDEIDAALDFKNVSIVGNYIKDRTKNAQFIIISLRSNMFELADLLVGIYKTFNCTKSATITPRIYIPGFRIIQAEPTEDNDDCPPRKRSREC